MNGLVVHQRVDQVEGVGVRWCINGTTCTGGTSHQFEDCYLKKCPEGKYMYMYVVLRRV